MKGSVGGCLKRGGEGGGGHQLTVVYLHAVLLLRHPLDGLQRGEVDARPPLLADEHAHHLLLLVGQGVVPAHLQWFFYLGILGRPTM